jgi:hypothetical protein
VCDRLLKSTFLFFPLTTHDTNDLSLISTSFRLLTSSVLFHKDWKFYEFNRLKGENLGVREPFGAIRTTSFLYNDLFDEHDLLFR